MEPTNQPNNWCYYEILNVPRDADTTKIREAYFKMSSTYQESNQALYSIFDESGLETELEKINLAYETLSDPEKRKKYDSKDLNLEDSHMEFGLQSPLPFEETPDLYRKHHAPIRAKACSEKSYQDGLNKILSERELGEGELLKEIRQFANVDFKEMQANIKVSYGMLQALEQNDFNCLPQPVYVKGFIRSFCNHLGVKEPEPIVSAYMNRYEAWCQNRGKKLVK